MNRKTIAIIGAHGSGKTTLCKAVAKSLGCIFHEEIGELLRVEHLARDSTAHAARPQPEFDREVIRREIERDALWHSSKEKFRVVETWHPGNIAYAQERSPEVITPEISAVLGRELEYAVVLPLRIEYTTAVARLRQSHADIPNEEMASFFLRVAQRAEDISREMGLTVLEPLSTEQHSVEESIAVAISKIRPFIVE